MLNKIISNENISQSEKIINNASKICIITHTSPDGDAMGSSLGLYHTLSAIDKESVIIVPNALQEQLKWMAGAESILVYEDYKSDAQRLIAEADLIICLDFNRLSRIGELAEFVSGNVDAKKILIDHHPFPEDFATVTISHPELSSTSEMVFRFICRLGFFRVMPIESAESIYTGIVTDTGNFSYNSSDPNLYFIINYLLEKGVDKNKVYNNVFQKNVLNKLKLHGYILSNNLFLIDEGRVGIIAVSKEELDRFGYQKGFLEGIVNIPLTIDGVSTSILLRDEETQVKISFRSLGDIDVNVLAEKLFGGGGHVNAAGAESKLPLSESITVIENYYRENI